MSCFGSQRVGQPVRRVFILGSGWRKHAARNRAAIGKRGMGCAIAVGFGRRGSGDAEGIAENVEHRRCGCRTHCKCAYQHLKHEHVGCDERDPHGPCFQSECTQDADLQAPYLSAHLDCENTDGFYPTVVRVFDAFAFGSQSLWQRLAYHR